MDIEKYKNKFEDFKGKAEKLDSAKRIDAPEAIQGKYILAPILLSFLIVCGLIAVLTIWLVSGSGIF